MDCEGELLLWTHCALFSCCRVMRPVFLLAVNCRFAKGMTLRMMLLGGNGAILVGAYELVKRLSRKTEPTPGFS